MGQCFSNSSRTILYFSIALGLFFGAWGVPDVSADEFTSTNFKLLDPIFQSGLGERLSSDSFRLIGSVSQIAIGTSTSASFEVRGGFLYFPAPAAPTPSPTPTPTPASAQGGVLESLLKAFGVRPPPRAIAALCAPPTDLDCDGKIGLSDLSILLYSVGRGFPNIADFNKDRVVDMEDLSILFTSWSEQVVPFKREERSRTRIVESARLPFGGFAAIGEGTLGSPPSPQTKDSRPQSREARPLRSVRVALEWIFSSLNAVGEQVRSWWTSLLR